MSLRRICASFCRICQSQRSQHRPLMTTLLLSPVIQAIPAAHTLVLAHHQETAVEERTQDRHLSEDAEDHTATPPPGLAAIRHQDRDRDLSHHHAAVARDPSHAHHLNHALLSVDVEDHTAAHHLAHLRVDVRVLTADRHQGLFLHRGDVREILQAHQGSAQDL